MSSLFTVAFSLPVPSAPHSLRWILFSPLRCPLWHLQIPVSLPAQLLFHCPSVCTASPRAEESGLGNSLWSGQAGFFLLGVPSAGQQRSLLAHLDKTRMAGVTIAQSFILFGYCLRWKLSVLSKRQEGKLRAGVAHGAQGGSSSTRSRAQAAQSPSGFFAPSQPCNSVS